MATDALRVEISVGEFIDKLTILEIKRSNITDPEKLANVEKEHAVLEAQFRDAFDPNAEFEALMDSLRTVNAWLWEIEDQIRDKERRRTFDDEFVELARSVYRINDRRAAIKRALNELTGSRFVEEKSYAMY